MSNALMRTNAVYDPPKDRRVAFWSDQNAWPEDAPQQIFAARAILRLGQLRFGADWYDDDPTAEWIAKLQQPLNLFTSYSEINRAVLVLRVHSPIYQLRNPAGLFGLAGGPDFPTRDEWSIASKVIDERKKVNWSKIYRFLVVANELADAAKNSKILCASRPFEGGEPTPLSWHAWNGERTWFRFDNCRIAESNPYGPAPPDGAGLWLFFERKSFEQYLSGGSPEGVLQQPSEVLMLKAQRPRRPGRRPKFDWDVMMADFLVIFQDEGIPEDVNISGIARRLLDTAAEKWDALPDEKTVQEKIRTWLSPFARA